MSQKILLVGETLGIGGAEKVTVDLANVLHASGTYRVSLAVTLAAGGVFAGRVAPGISVNLTTTPEQLGRLVATEKPDAILFNNCRLVPGCMNRVLASHRPGYVGFFLHGFGRYSLDLLPRAFPAGAHVITMSREAAAGIRKARPDLPRQAVAVLQNCVDTDRFQPAVPGADPYAVPGIAGGGPVIGYAGRFSGEKALVTLVDVFRRVHARIPGARLLMVGGADPGTPVHAAYWNAERRTVEQAVRQLGLQDAVHITGAVPNPEDYYPVMDALVLTSLFEGVPLVLLEAMACGVPAVCTAVGAIPRLLACGAGVAIARRGNDLDEAERELFAARLVDLVTSPRRKAMGGAGRAFVCRNLSLAHYRRAALDYFKERIKPC